MSSPEFPVPPDSKKIPTYVIQSILDQELEQLKAAGSSIGSSEAPDEQVEKIMRVREGCISEVVDTLNSHGTVVSNSLEPDERHTDLTQLVELALLEAALTSLKIKVAVLSARNKKAEMENSSLKATRQVEIDETLRFIEEIEQAMNNSGFEVNALPIDV